MNPQIRDERPGDEGAIHSLTALAFRTMPYSSGTEQHIIDTLRAEGALTVSLVAELDAKIVGHIAFSPVTIAGADAEWYALGPVSVHPDVQRLGIGSALIREGLARLKARGAAGCVLAGDTNYYGRFGFVRDSAFVLTDTPPEASMVLRFRGDTDGGVVRFHPAFSHA